MRLLVYTDYVYRREGSTVYAPRAFALFVSALRPHVERLVIAGRLDPRPGRSHYPLPPDVEFLALPHYVSAAQPGAVAWALLRALRRLRVALDGVDVAWALGPHGLAIPVALLAHLRGRRVVLGVRQDLPAYVRHRHPGKPAAHAAADVLEAAFRALARRWPMAVVGPDLAERYARARAVLPLAVSLVSERHIRAAAGRPTPDGGEELRLLTVGRLEPEKNPLLLADVLRRLHERDDRWRLVVCGEGPLEGALRERLEALGVAHAAELRGYVGFDELVERVYPSAHVFLHVSWTEGLPQVLWEAFATGVPVVATDVGGVAAGAGGAALLVPPGDAESAVRRVLEIQRDGALRARLRERGLAVARQHTLEAEVAHLAAFLGESSTTYGTSLGLRGRTRRPGRSVDGHTMPLGSKIRARPVRWALVLAMTGVLLVAAAPVARAGSAAGAVAGPHADRGASVTASRMPLSRRDLDIVMVSAAGFLLAMLALRRYVYADGSRQPIFGAKERRPDPAGGEERDDA